MSDQPKSPEHMSQSANPRTADTSLPFWRQLRWNLILLSVGLVILPLAVVLGITMVVVQRQTTDQVIRQLDSIAALKLDRIHAWLDEARFVLDLPLTDAAKKDLFASFASRTLADVEFSEDEFTRDITGELLEKALQPQSLFTEYFIYNAQGRVIAATNPAQIGKIVSQQPYFADSLVGTFVQSPYFEIGRSELTMLVTHPLVGAEDQVVGALAGRLDMTVLGNIMLERAGLRDSGETYLVSLENNMLVTPSRFEGYPANKPGYHSQGIDAALSGQNGEGVYDGYREPSAPVIGVYRWAPELQVALLAEQDEEEALHLFQQALVWSLSVAAGAVVLTSLAALYGALHISRPVTALTQVATRIAQGNLDERVEVAEGNEIGLLAAAFNTMTIQLRELVGSLEEQVAARTRRLESVAVLGERLSAILDPQALLPEAVNQIQNRFGYYHAHIYLLDEAGGKLVVAAGTGEAGAEMKARGHSIPLDAPTSLVARAARFNQIIKVDNVRETEDWLPNPLLPDTYAEMAVPIVVDNQVVGVLDVQADQVAGLDESDTSLLRSVANQVSVSLRNARLFANVETALAEAHEAQQRYVVQSWEQLKLRRRNKGRVQFSLGETSALSEEAMLEGRQLALAHKEPAVVTINGQDHGSGDGPSAGNGQKNALVAPITLHSVAIGNLQFHDTDSSREWTEGELALINGVIDQVAQAAETLRLLDESQERASREQFVAQVSDKMRRAPDLEGLVQMAVSELSRTLGSARTFARLGSEVEFTGQNDSPDDPATTE